MLWQGQLPLTWPQAPLQSRFHQPHAGRPMIDDATRILALEGRLDDLQRTLMAHDLLLRALLAHLAVTEPEAFRQLAKTLGGLTVFRAGGAGGELPAEVAQELADILGEITRSVEKRS
jgi:hypothetical protein